MRSRCESIANEILMHFRSQRKLQGEVSLADTLEAAGEGGCALPDGRDCGGRQYAGGVGYAGRMCSGASVRKDLPNTSGTDGNHTAIWTG